MVRVEGDPLTVVPALESAVAALDPDARIDAISTMDDIVSRAFAPWRFSGVVVSAFAAIALAFAAVGIATLVAFGVAQRTREIGVRVALGAQRRDVVALVASEGARVALAGLAVGVLTAWILRRSVESMLFGISPGDALTFAAVPLVLGIVSVLSAYLPARRAARIDPVAALRME
jgi:putative ABC transport system permease protein